LLDAQWGASLSLPIVEKESSIATNQLDHIGKHYLKTNMIMFNVKYHKVILHMMPKADKAND
jgi:hypothetical protein